MKESREDAGLAPLVEGLEHRLVGEVELLGVVAAVEELAVDIGAALRRERAHSAAKSGSPIASAMLAAAFSAARYMLVSHEFGPNSSMSSVWCWRPQSTPVLSGSQRSGLSGDHAYSIARLMFGQ